MAGFDLGELLPYYLDETDEQIVALNDALLKLEKEPDDAPVLREAFRMVHSIKGSSTVMGFDQVKRLSHHLETIFEQLRSGQRTLDKPTLDLSFRCLDGLRDYHKELRNGNQDAVDLSNLTDQVFASLAGESATPIGELPAVPSPDHPLLADDPESVRVTVRFVQGLAWADMKAKLVLNRLSSRARVLATEPSAEALEGIDQICEFTVWLVPECDHETLRSLADVEGVTRIVIDESQPPGRDAKPADVAVAGAEIEMPAMPGLDSNPSGDPRGELATFVDEATAVPKATTKKVGETLRVDVERLDQLMNLAGELVINRSRFYEIAGGLEDLFRDSSASFLTSDTQDRLDSLSRELEAFGDHPARVAATGALDRWIAQFRRLRENFKAIQDELDAMCRGRDQINALTEAIHQLARVTDGIQKGVLDTRMVPIGPLFDRFQRVVRDLRLLSHKEVTLRIEGEKTELDKRMIDELADPLIHMVRNSVDHGLETPDERERAGKPRSGTISLIAAHRGNSVVIVVGDDGRGIDCERVRQKVVSKGLLPADEARRLNERQVVNYIWHPGLSTAEAVTDISGRGVGMDIVKSRIEKLNGTVDVRTEAGLGTTFTIRLPLTLAIMPCLLVQIFEEVYAIPLDHIDEIVEVESRNVNRVRNKRLITIRDRLVSLVGLEELVTWGGDPQRSTRNAGAEAEKRTVVVAHNGDTMIGMLVDQLIGMQEIVLKPLEKNFRPVHSLSGASILGDGRVSLILDIDALIEMVGRDAARQVG